MRGGPWAVSPVEWAAKNRAKIVAEKHTYHSLAELMCDVGYEETTPQEAAHACAGAGFTLYSGKSERRAKKG